LSIEEVVKEENKVAKYPGIDNAINQDPIFLGPSTHHELVRIF
jgi:hypothetical protein